MGLGATLLSSAVALVQQDGRTVMSVINRIDRCVSVGTQALRPGDGKVIERKGFLALHQDDATRQSWSRDVAAVGVTLSEPHSCSLGYSGTPHATVAETFTAGRPANTHGVP